MLVFIFFEIMSCIRTKLVYVSTEITMNDFEFLTSLKSQSTNVIYNFLSILGFLDIFKLRVFN